MRLSPQHFRTKFKQNGNLKKKLYLFIDLQYTYFLNSSGAISIEFKFIAELIIFNII